MFNQYLMLMEDSERKLTNSEGWGYNYRVVMTMTYDSSNGLPVEDIIEGHTFEHPPTLEECLEELPLSLGKGPLDDESEVISFIYDVWSCDLEDDDMWYYQEAFFVVNKDGVPI